MLHPDRNFATIACRGDDARGVLASLEFGTSCALLTADAAGRALCVESRDDVLDVRRTLDVDGRGRLQVASLRTWLQQRKKAQPRSLAAVVNRGAGPYLCRPLQMGADVVVEDLGDLLGSAYEGGAAVCARTDALLARFLGEVGIEPPREGDTTPVEEGLAPMLPMLGIVTQARCDRAMVAASYLAVHPGVSWVSYPGLADDPANDAARRALEHGFGWRVAFGADCDPTVFEAGFSPRGRFGTSRVEARAAGTFLLSCGLEEPLDIVGFLEGSVSMGPRERALP